MGELTTTRHNNVTIVLGRTRMRDNNNYIGTIEYVGTVGSAKDSSVTYVGVVWDDHSRGIHDGSVTCRSTGKVMRHFSCAPGAGSFIRLATADLGRVWEPSLAVTERYIAIDSDQCLEAPNNVFPHSAQTVSGRNNKPIEFHGEMKIRSQQQIQNLRSISLRRSGIHSIDTVQDWSSLQHLQEIDLSGNLLSDWKCVVDIIKCFPNLVSFSLHGNRINDIDEYIDRPLSEKLIHLNVKATNIRSIQTVVNIGTLLPNLKELIVANNPIFASNLNEDKNSIIVSRLRNVFLNLVYLDCSNCTSPASSFDQHDNRTNPVDSLWSRLPALRYLSLDDNPIQELHGSYIKLTHLQLSGTGFSSWSAIDSINDKIPCLQSLRFRNAPILKHCTDAVNRYIIVSHLPRIQQLNGNAVTEHDKREAARYCIHSTLRDRQLLKQQASAVVLETTGEQGNSQKVSNLERGFETKSDHCQFKYWVGQYPDFASRLIRHDASTNDCQSSSCTLVADTLVNVTIRSMEPSSCTVVPLQRRFPRHLTIGQIKTLCARQFGLDVDLQMLYFVVYDNDHPSQLPTAMDQGDKCSLDDYGIPSNGAEIFMHKIEEGS